QDQRSEKIMMYILLSLAVGLVMLPHINAKCEPAYYLGCFVDAASRDIEYGFAYFPGMTLELCQEHCRNLGYKYTGAQAGSQCFCDNDFGKYGSKPDGECSWKCVGNNQQKCGGHFRNSVYLVR
ncbi:unnamed protein product, partial [Owenia fusiformis]